MDKSVYDLIRQDLSDWFALNGKPQKKKTVKPKPKTIQRNGIEYTFSDQFAKDLWLEDREGYDPALFESVEWVEVWENEDGRFIQYLDKNLKLVFEEEA